MTTSQALGFALLAHLSVAAVACGSYGASDSSSSPSAPVDADAAAPHPKAPGVGGPADASEFTEAFGFFVSPSGSPSGAGTRKDPLASVQAAIALGKSQGKRVYVCAGTYKEALLIADSISVIGGLDCSGPEWRTSSTRTRIESPTSPAVRADDIVTATRLEGLDVVAPSATAASDSSIGLIATNAAQLTIASSRITAGNGADGPDGSEGAQLSNAATANGAPQYLSTACTNATCNFKVGYWFSPPGAAGGINSCDGVPAHVAGNGGQAGAGGTWDIQGFSGAYRWNTQPGAFSFTAGNGDPAGLSAIGTKGPDGANAAPLGSFSRQGYAQADGTAGQDGTPGKGGAGGNGNAPTQDPNTVPADVEFRGISGAGGGAGGCPGLAGTAGKGGGASIAALVEGGTVTFQLTELVTGHGGKGGLGTFGSSATPGGTANNTGISPSMSFVYGKDGGHGGASGFSGNGASGPSLGIVHHGAAPILDGAKVTLGAPGAAIPARTHTDALGVTKTIPATPAGVSQDLLAL